MRELAGHAPPRYEYSPRSLDDRRKTFERGRALESTTHTQMWSSRRLYYKGCAALQQACSPHLFLEVRTLHPNVADVVAWVGLDWADQQHYGRLQAVGSSVMESFVLPHRPEALQDWVRELRTRFPFGRVAIAVEQSRGALVYALMTYDFLVLYPVPPKTLADYRKAFFGSGAKSDPQDADLLLELLRCHADRLHAWQPDDAPTRQLQLLVEHRRKLVDDRTRLTNRLTSLLKDSFPQAREWAGELGTPRACQFLTRWPSLAALQQARRSRVRPFYLDHGWKDLARLDQIQQAQPLTSDAAVLQASALLVRLLAQQLSALLPALVEIDQAIAQLFAPHPDQSLWDSFPGAGEVLAPRLLAAFGTASVTRRPRKCSSSPASLRSRSAAASLAGCMGVWLVPSSYVRPSTSSQLTLAAGRLGPTPIMNSK